MQDRIKKLLIPGILILFLVTIAIILGIRRARNDSLIISDASFQTLSNVNATYGSSYYINFLNLLLRNYGEISIVLLQIVLACASFYLMYLILKSQETKVSITLNVLIFVLISPAFLWSTLVINTQILIFFLFILTGYLFLKKNIFSYLFAALLLITDVFSFFIFFSILLFYKKKYLWSLILSLLPLFLAIRNISSIQNIVFELGVVSGYSIGLLILMLIGIGLSRDKIKENNGIYLIFLIILLQTLVLGNYLIFLIPLTYFGAPQLYALLKSKWSIEIMKKITLALILITLLIPFLYSANLIAKSPPSFDDVNSLKFLSSQESGEVLSCQNYGYIISYVGEHDTVIKKQNKIVDEIFNTYSRTETREFLKKINAKYIWVNPEMKNRLWPNEKRFYFVLQDQTTFSRIYEENGREIYEVIT